MIIIKSKIKLECKKIMEDKLCAKIIKMLMIETKIKRAVIILTVEKETS